MGTMVVLSVLICLGSGRKHSFIQMPWGPLLLRNTGNPQSGKNRNEDRAWGSEPETNIPVTNTYEMQHFKPSSFEF